MQSTSFLPYESIFYSRPLRRRTAASCPLVNRPRSKLLESLGILRLGATNDLARILNTPRDSAFRQAHRLGRRCSGCTRSTNRGKKSLPSIFTCAKRRKSPVLFERK